MASKVVVRRSNRADIVRRLKALRGARVTVGMHGDAGTTADGTSLVLIAGVHEFGAPSVGVPERAPIRKAIDANRNEYRTMLRRMSSVYVMRGTPLRSLLNLFGEKVVADIRGTIAAGLSPGLSETTIERRKARLASNGGKARNSVFTDTEGGWTPLIDTGRLVNSYSYKVET